jgi:hypothetical protein
MFFNTYNIQFIITLASILLYFVSLVDNVYLLKTPIYTYNETSIYINRIDDEYLYECPSIYLHIIGIISSYLALLTILCKHSKIGLSLNGIGMIFLISNYLTFRYLTSICNPYSDSDITNFYIWNILINVLYFIVVIIIYFLIKNEEKNKKKGILDIRNGVLFSPGPMNRYSILIDKY